jgi:hypothetical protein
MSNRNNFPCKGTTVLGSNSALKALNSKVILQESQAQIKFYYSRLDKTLWNQGLGFEEHLLLPCYFMLICT